MQETKKPGAIEAIASLKFGDFRTLLAARIGMEFIHFFPEIALDHNTLYKNTRGIKGLKDKIKSGIKASIERLKK